mmetsp:Transcript_12709/g.32238  ORF Transcript_12709/g.32238 Transcript_12709/m.32238 type:complete len:161 (-) Transcript_12709:607-1089(-)
MRKSESRSFIRRAEADLSTYALPMPRSPSGSGEDGHTTAIEEETVGSRLAKEVEGRSATARCTEMLVFAAVLVRLLLVTLLALVSGAARGLMLLDVGPSSLAHSACSPTPWEVTAAGSRAVDKATTAVLVSESQARIMATSMEAAAGRADPATCSRLGGP